MSGDLEIVRVGDADPPIGWVFCILTVACGSGLTPPGTAGAPGAPGAFAKGIVFAPTGAVFLPSGPVLTPIFPVFLPKVPVFAPSGPVFAPIGVGAPGGVGAFAKGIVFAPTGGRGAPPVAGGAVLTGAVGPRAETGGAVGGAGGGVGAAGGAAATGAAGAVDPLAGIVSDAAVGVGRVEPESGIGARPAGAVTSS